LKTLPKFIQRFRIFTISSNFLKVISLVEQEAGGEGAGETVDFVFPSEEWYYESKSIGIRRHGANERTCRNFSARARGLLFGIGSFTQTDLGAVV